MAIIFLPDHSRQYAQKVNKAPSSFGKFAQADAVTHDIRDSSKSLIQVSVKDNSDRAIAASYGRIVGDYGSFLVLTVDKGMSFAGLALPQQTIDTSISLNSGSFDPVVKPPAATELSGANGYFIVQFGTTANDELLDSLKSAGVEVLQYIPNQAFFVYGSSESISAISGHSRVRWVGPYLPAYKIPTVLTEQLNADKNIAQPRKGISPIEKISPDNAIFDVAVFDRANLASVATQISFAFGGKVLRSLDLSNNYFNLLRIEMPLARVKELANIPEVISIEAWSRPEKEDEVAAQIVAGNYVGNTVGVAGYNPLAQFGVNGSNVTVAVSDDGIGIPGDGDFYVTAANSINGPLRGATIGASGHGHMQASIIAGASPFSILDPGGYNYGLGIAPGANTVNIPFLRSGYNGSDSEMISDAVITAGPNGVAGSIVNNSWGSGTNGNAYDSLAAQFDGFVRDGSLAAGIDPITIIFSAGNSGAGGLTRPKVAKNVIAVAASENVRPTSPSAGGSTGFADNLEQLPDFSSRGPASDTRIKPDITAPGDAITGGRSGTDTLFGNIDNFHRISSGTSHAAPQIAGAAALFTEFWKSTNGASNPSPALIKAALINGAVDMTGSGASAAVPNASEGWGRVNLKNVLNTGAATTYVNQTAVLADTGNARLYAGTVADSSRPVRVTLVWTDPPAASDPALVNNLDLEVTVGGSTYRGNVLTGGLSATGGTADNRNNVENVFLPAGTTGPINIRVLATAINGDGVLGNADTTDQHFALLVFNSNVTPDASASLSTGVPSLPTGNGIIEPNECNIVNIPLTNNGDTAATAVSATLTTNTSGVAISTGSSAYGNIAGSGATQVNSTPFQVSTASGIACGTTINLTLTVNYTGGASPAVFNIPLVVGMPADPNYAFVSSTSTIPTGGVLVTGSADDDAVVSIPLPSGFSSTVYGTPVTTLNADTNGNLRINGVGTSAFENTSLPSRGSGTQLPASSPVLFPYWDDLDFRPAEVTGGGIFTNTTGTAPNRQLVIEWRGKHFNDAGTDINTNFAVVLTEGSDTIRYIYNLTGIGGNLNGASATVGAQAASTGTQFTQFSFNAASLSAGLQLTGTRAAGICVAGSGPCSGGPTPTLTPTPAPTPTPSCTPNANLVVDGGFEATNDSGNNPNWASTSTAFGTSLCTPGACGTAAAPRNGNGWLWLDGTGSGTNAESGTAQQTITIPAGGTATLNYYLWISGVTAPSNSVLTVTVDGTVVQTITEPGVVESGYTLRTVDLSAFANGSPRLLSFNYSRPAGTSGSDNFLIDDITVSTTCPVSNAIVSGRVVTPSGLGLRNAIVVLTDSQGARRTATTSSFGFYSFEAVAVGQTYIMGVSSKRYRFAAKMLNVGGNLNDVDFVGLE